MDIAGIQGVGATSAISGRQGLVTVDPTKSVEGGTFDQVLGQVVNGAIETVQAGEAAAIQGVKGALPAFKVVEAVMSAQRTLQEALAVRDKAVSAYHEISRMTI